MIKKGKRVISLGLYIYFKKKVCLIVRFARIYVQDQLKTKYRKEAEVDSYVIISSVIICMYVYIEYVHKEIVTLLLSKIVFESADFSFFLP